MNNTTEKTEKERLDKLNNERVEKTRMAVAEALHQTDVMNEWWNTHDSDEAVDDERSVSDADDLAYAINRLDTAAEEMMWACSHFDWNDDVVYLINDAVAYFGSALAMLVLIDSEEFDGIVVSCNLTDGRIKLAKALATLVSWFKD